jgi:hypothetical protein
MIALPEFLAGIGAIVSALALLNLGLKIHSKIRANRLAVDKLRQLKHSEIVRLSRILRSGDIDPVEFEKIMRRIESLLADGLDKKSLGEINEALYQRSSRGRVRYAASLLESAQHDAPVSHRVVGS